MSSLGSIVLAVGGSAQGYQDPDEAVRKTGRQMHLPATEFNKNDSGRGGGRVQTRMDLARKIHRDRRTPVRAYVAGRGAVQGNAPSRMPNHFACLRSGARRSARGVINGLSTVDTTGSSRVGR